MSTRYAQDRLVEEMADAVRLGESMQGAAKAQRGLGQIRIPREIEEGDAEVLTVMERLLG
jgi:hypothetical protein